MVGLLLSVPFVTDGGGNDTGAACLATGVTGLADDVEIDDSMGEEETAHPPGDPFPVELFLNEDLEKLFFTGASLLLPLLLGDEGGDALPFIVTLLDGMEAAVDELLLVPALLPIPPPLAGGVEDPTILLSDVGVDDFILNEPLAKLFFTGTTLSLLPPIMLLLAE